MAGLFIRLTLLATWAFLCPNNTNTLVVEKGSLVNVEECKTNGGLGGRTLHLLNKSPLGFIIGRDQAILCEVGGFDGNNNDIQGNAQWW